MLSRSYRKANTRLRKMGLPELDDVTSTRLKLRPAIEDEIEKIIVASGFQRVQIKHPSDDANPNERTEWNRALHLYERRTAPH